MCLVGGQLLTGLRAWGIGRHLISDVICTHVHSDHVGWLFDQQADPVFPNATVWLGASEWPRIDDPVEPLADNLEAGLRRYADTGELRLVDGDTVLIEGITAVCTPGHTPGHLCVEVASEGSRLLLLGDAITCPMQLSQPGWHSMGDVDPILAEETRQGLLEVLRDDRTSAVGAHFPELRPGRMTVEGWTDL
jgi:glyoxylase-like metal-dependent hydrolase (beta-lactamase superfamily II)